MSSPDASLRDLFAEARRREEDMSHLDSRSETYKSNLQDLIHKYEECQALASRLALFSTNEEIDDVSTQDIQYLSIDYLLAEVLLKAYSEQRQKTLNRAVDLLDSFLTRLDQYGILSQTDRTLYEQFRENKTGFRIGTQGTMEERRNIKITRFQEEKALKSKLQYLRVKSQENTADEETMRGLYLAELALFSSQAFQSIDMMVRESDVLRLASLSEPRKQTPNDSQTTPGRKDEYSERLDDLSSGPGLGRYGGPLLNKDGKPLQPFTILDKRTQLRQGVFRPDHNLPTMTIDEYLEEERRRGGIIEGGGNANARGAEPDEDNMAYADAQTMKAREWDEFVETHPKGSGNTLNRG